MLVSAYSEEKLPLCEFDSEDSRLSLFFRDVLSTRLFNFPRDLDWTKKKKRVWGGASDSARQTSCFAIPGG